MLHVCNVTVTFPLHICYKTDTFLLLICYITVAMKNCYKCYITGTFVLLMLCNSNIHVTYMLYNSDIPVVLE